MQCNGSDIRWKYITNLYLRNTGQVTETPGLSLVLKIKYEHVHLTSFLKMRVDLAAEVYMHDVMCMCLVLLNTYSYRS